jgi:hypothetical protein
MHLPENRAYLIIKQNGEEENRAHADGPNIIKEFHFSFSIYLFSNHFLLRQNKKKSLQNYIGYYKFYYNFIINSYANLQNCHVHGTIWVKKINNKFDR